MYTCTPIRVPFYLGLCQQCLDITVPRSMHAAQATEKICAVTDGEHSYALIPQTASGIKSLFQESNEYFWLVDCLGTPAQLIPIYQAALLEHNVVSSIITQPGVRVGPHFVCPAFVIVVGDRGGIAALQRRRI